MSKLLEWCLEKGKVGKGRKHRGLRMIDPNREKAKEHIEKAVHNADFMKDVVKLEKYDDWVFRPLFMRCITRALQSSIILALRAETKNALSQ